MIISTDIKVYFSQNKPIGLYDNIIQDKETLGESIPYS